MKICRYIGVVVFGAFLLSLLPHAAGNDKKEPAKASAAEIEKLVKDLGSKNEKTANNAIESLEKIGQLAAGDLFDVVHEKKDSKMRSNAILTLGLIRQKAAKEKDDAATEVIEDVLLRQLRDPDGEIVNAAAGALTGNMPRSKRAIPELIAILRSDDKPYLARAAASVGLQNFGPEAAVAIPVLLECLQHKVEHKIHVEGKTALERAEKYRQAFLTSKKYVEGERAGLCRVFRAIGPKDARVVSAMSKILKNRTEHPLLRGGAAHFLVESATDAGQAALPDIVDALVETGEKKKDFPFSILRNILISALGHVKLTHKEVTLLVAVAVNPDEAVDTRELAVRTLTSAGKVSHAAWLPLYQVLQDEGLQPGTPRIDIVIALGKIDPPPDEDRAALAKALKLTFDRILRDRNDPDLAAEMAESLKKIEKR